MLKYNNYPLPKEMGEIGLLHTLYVVKLYFSFQLLKVLFNVCGLIII